MKKDSKIDKVLEYAREHGVIRVRDAIAEGMHPEYLRRLCDQGLLIKIGRGTYIPSDMDFSENIGLAQIAKRVPHAVVCLLSALLFHDIGTQLPHEIWIAIDRKAARPRLKYPPVRVMRFSGKSLSEGIEEHIIEGVTVKVYNKAKTVADCFKYRNKIGLDVALEALKDCRRRRLCSNDELWQYAKICRVSKVMKPYLEALS
jgi:predicted transcriptional regulator of viral defense system